MKTVISAAIAALALVPACKSDEKGAEEPAAPAPEAAATGTDGEGAAESAAAGPAGDAAPASSASAELVEEGAEAPDFTAEAHDGSEVTLSALRGSPVVLYFYPKDETPGCTREAEAFRDQHGDFEELGAEVIGVSLDSLASHREFAAGHDLPFRLVSDEDREITAKYGVDTSSGYAERVTFVIDAEGQIAEVFPGVDVRGHAAAVLAAVRAL